MTGAESAVRPLVAGFAQISYTKRMLFRSFETFSVIFEIEVTLIPKIYTDFHFRQTGSEILEPKFLDD
ncbi:hypothetical protein [Leptospira noguchii]|uniref:hypothetical protein n=1 Tax=Leptospira noguchii TaxID=28182 RepID=UPI000B27294D|nr:hypothetical protein [Leptospira noguchii]UOG52120.1 hypothetical protein MAL09_16055 [Leptospira noguchii]